MTNICLGVIAHVDSGKTTLTEQILYKTGSIRKLGRVDHRDTFFDTVGLERKRGITIFSKQASFVLHDKHFTLIDTPGHADFSAEMERCLNVLDYAILLISGPEGLQQHVFTLWKLLIRYNIPTFVFINKMDREDTNRNVILNELNQRLGKGFYELSDLENIAMLDDELTEAYLESEELSEDDISGLITERVLFPCFFGSALTGDGVDILLNAVSKLSREKKYPNDLSAVCYKITHDDKNNRFSYLKITGGELNVKECLDDEKVEQMYEVNGNSMKPLQHAYAGDVVAVVGLSNSFSGKVYGKNVPDLKPELVPLYSAKIVLPDELDVHDVFMKLKQFNEELPEISLDYDVRNKDILISLMGDIQTEILTSLIKERFDIDVTFSDSSIIYKETVLNPCYGVGHYEPLKHYAEVHVVIEPIARGRGIIIASDMSTDDLPLHFQRLIMTNIGEKHHKGVLTGSELTDVKITLVNAKHHLKHTEGGDFRQAAYRAVRNALMYGESILLEPYYSYSIRVPNEYTGRLMTDLSAFKFEFSGPEVDDGFSTFTGKAPVSKLQPYIRVIMQYTGGKAEIIPVFSGYGEAYSTDEVINAYHYDPEADMDNQPGSVFCEHGAGFYVPWNEVCDHMHLEKKSTFFNENAML